MRKLILGIIAVVCLDIGFMVYMGSDRSAEMIATALDTGADGSDLMANRTSDRIETWRFSDNEPTVITAEKPSRTIADRQRQDALARLSIKKERPGVNEVDARRPSSSYALFKPVIIEIKKGNGPVRSPERTPADVEKGDRSRDNKSLVAKALPILKKPYDWLKALGSKIR